MATMNLARFTINGTPAEDTNGVRGYDATAGEELAITLEKNPALGVLTVTYALFDASQPYGETPLNSLFDTDQVFDENGARAITTSSPNQTFHVTINPATEISSYTLRATVVTATGAQMFERLIAVRKNGLRMTVPSESLQYSQRGWSDALNELTKAVADGLAGVVLVSAVATGTVAAFPTGQRRIFHSDGSTVGGTWAQLSNTDMTSALADGAVPAIKIAPGTDGQVLRTSGTSVVWGADVTLNPPANPGDNGKVALASSGNLSYGYIANAQVASGANIAVNKLAPGTNGQSLKTVGGVVAWSTDNMLTAPVNPTDDGKVALASGGDLVYGYISNAQVATGANIAVNKLATGTEGYVLTVVAGVPTWAVAGGGGANLPATPADDTKVAFANGGNLDYADAVKMLNVGSGQNGLSLAGLLVTSAGSPPQAPAGSEAALFNSSGAPKWQTTGSTQDLLRGTQPAAGNVNQVAIVNASGWYNAGLIANVNIAAGAGIEATKLAAGTDNYVLRSSGGSVGWALISDSNISSSAEIAVSKLANGTDGQYLRTSGANVVWTSSLEGSQITNATVTNTKIAPGSANQVLRTNYLGTAVEWAQLININIATGANIDVNKLAPGALNSLLASNGTSNFWSTTPTVSTLTGTTALITNGYMQFTQTTTPSSAPSNGARIFVQGNGVLGAIFDDTTVWEFAVEAFN